MDSIKQLFAAIAAVFTWKAKKLDLDNTPSMQARAQGASDQQIKDKAARDIKEGNIDAIRNDLAE